MLPLASTTEFTLGAELGIALVCGLGFGFAPERAGFGRARQLPAAFYFYDLAGGTGVFTPTVTPPVGRLRPAAGRGAGGGGTCHGARVAAGAHGGEDGRGVKRGQGPGAYGDRRAVERDVPPKPGTEMTVRLEAAQAKVADADEYAAQARAERDELVRAAIADGLTMYRIAQVTGLSQATVALIRG